MRQSQPGRRRVRIVHGKTRDIVSSVMATPTLRVPTSREINGCLQECCQTYFQSNAEKLTFYRLTNL